MINNILLLTANHLEPNCTKLNLRFFYFFLSFRYRKIEISNKLR